jgi:hypothetical protein
MSASEPPIINVTDEIMPLLNRSATRIQRLNRAIRQRRATAERRYQEQISREFDENMTRTRNEERQRELDSVIGLDQILRQEQAATNGVAATRIQSAVRNRNALNETISRATRKKELNDAATTIQSAVRNRNALNETISKAKQKQTNETLNNAMENIKKQDAQADANDLISQLSNKTEYNAATKIGSVFKGHKGRAKTERLKIYKNTIKDIPVRSNLTKRTSKRGYLEIIDKEPPLKRQFAKDTTTEDTIKDVMEGMIKRVEKSHGLQKLKVPKVKKGNPVLKRQYDIKYIPQNTVKEMYNELKLPIQSDLQNKNLNASTKINSVIKGHLSRKDTRNEILKQASNEKTAATTLQNTIRNRNAKRDMMQQRQLVGKAQLKQMEENQRQMQAAKADKAKKEDIAAKQLQAISKRIKAQSDVSKIKQAKDKIGAATKRLLTERVDSFYGPKTGKSYIINKKTMGQPLVVNKKLKLVSKKKHDAGVFGYETRQDYLDLAEQYKDIMTKGQKKK